MKFTALQILDLLIVIFPSLIKLNKKYFAQGRSLGRRGNRVQTWKKDLLKGTHWVRAVVK